MEIKKQCFVIMPFSQTSNIHTKKYWTEHFANFLKPLIEGCPSVEAARSRPLRGDIVKQIITDLITSPIVVADLTDMNPNVLWELGVRQSFRHGTITIAEKGTKLPFDLRPKATLNYFPLDHIKNAKFCADLKEALVNCLEKPDAADSSVLETISGRGTLYEIVHREEAIRRLDALVAECNWNVSILGDILRDVRHNKANPKRKRWVTARFMSAGIELLLTNRYLDEGKSFYKAVQVGFSSCLALNDQLNNRYANPQNSDAWFEKYCDMYLKRFEKLEALATKTQKKLIERIPALTQ